MHESSFLLFELSHQRFKASASMFSRYKRTDEERVRCFLVQETRRGIQVTLSSHWSIL